MKIPPQPPSRSTPQTAERRSADSKKSDRFARLVKRENKNDTASGDGALRAQEPQLKSPLVAIGNLPVVGLAALAPQGSTSADGLRSARSGSPLPPELQALTDELGARLEIVKDTGATRELNLSFESQAFAGLRVQLQQSAAGEVNIQFATQVPAISRLLRQHVGELRETLAQKGVKVRALTVGDAPARPSPERYSHA